MDDFENPENWYESEPEYVDSGDPAADAAVETADDSAPVSTDAGQQVNMPADQHPKVRKNPPQKRKKRRRRRRKTDSATIVHTIVYMVIVLAVSIAAAVMLWFAADDVLALTKPDEEVTITLQKGESLDEVAETLKENGLINYKGLFKLYGKFSNAEDRFGSGTFVLNKMFDYHALVNGLSSTSDTRKTVTLTFPEGYSVDQIIAMLAENDVCSEDDLKDICANYEFDYEFLQDIPYGDYRRLEGFMFPDTYDFYVGDDAQRVVNKFLSNFDDKFTEDMYAAIDSLNETIRSKMEADGSFTEEEINNAMMDVYSVITVASLIEKEAGSDSERPVIASVIYNRLTSKVNEYLQIDATIEYALGEHKEKLTDDDLLYDSPYNTYLYKGLTPGPIANPGYSSIMAALYPDDTNYYFYAVNGSGTHNFFENYYEQQEFLNSSSTDTAEESAETTETEDAAADAEESDAADAEAAAGDTTDGEPFAQTTITNENGEEETINVQ